MLSLVDLIEAGTVNLDLAAYLAAVVAGGHSLLVGANPGGAGKTTVMAALLAFLPPGCAIEPVADRRVLADAARDHAYGETCYLAHEVGAGSYYAYVWGAEARAFFALAGAGHIIATNLHADTLSETKSQLCGQNGVAPVDLHSVTLKLYLRLYRGRDWQVDRRVSHVYESDGEKDRLVWTHTPDEGFCRVASSRIVSEQDQAAWRAFLASCVAAGTRELAPVVTAAFARMFS